MRKVAFWLSLAFIFFVPWENIAHDTGYSLISKTFGFLVAVVWSAAAVNTRILRKPRLFHIFALLFVLWNVASFLWSVDGDRTLERLLTYAQLFVLAYIIWDLYGTAADIRAGMQAYVLGAFVSIISILNNYSNGTTETYQRFSAAGFNPNDIAWFLALGLPLAWHLAISGGNGRKTQLLRVVNYVYIPAAILAILLTASRAGFAAVVPAFLFILVSSSRLRSRGQAVVVVGMIVSFIVLQPLVPISSIQRITDTVTEVTKGDLNQRTYIWKEGISIFSEHPILGIGSGAFRAAASETGKVAHNTALSLLAEVGVIGFGLFAAAIAAVIYQSRHLPKWSLLLWLTILMIWLVGSATHNYEMRKQTWLFLTLAVASAATTSRGDEAVSLVIRGRPIPTFMPDISANRSPQGKKEQSYLV